MKIVRIIGGLGNQMFQYALALALKQQQENEEVKLDLSAFRGYNKHGGFHLAQCFGTTLPAATWQEVAQLAWYYPHYQLWRLGHRVLPVRKTMLKEPDNGAFLPEVLQRKGDAYYEGYWQDERYFSHYRPAILQAFTFPAFTNPRNLAVQQQINTTESVAIHVRRGDYLHDALFRNTCGLAYYQRAITCILQHVVHPVFYVFSDDMAWCRQHIQPLLQTNEAVFVDWNHGKACICDLHLMTLCRHHIIANSSFSWWGAWLSPHQAGWIIAPKQWYAHEEKVSPAAERWLKL